jgi:hypothetical protein
MLGIVLELEFANEEIQVYAMASAQCQDGFALHVPERERENDRLFRFPGRLKLSTHGLKFRRK